MPFQKSYHFLNLVEKHSHSNYFPKLFVKFEFWGYLDWGFYTPGKGVRGGGKLQKFGSVYESTWSEGLKNKITPRSIF